METLSLLKQAVMSLRPKVLKARQDGWAGLATLTAAGFQPTGTPSVTAAALNESIVTSLESLDVTGTQHDLLGHDQGCGHRGYRRLNSDTVLVYRQRTTGNTTRPTSSYNSDRDLRVSCPSLQRLKCLI
jgi:hypothetical protein